MTLVKFITEDRILRNIHFYENRIFTNKVKSNIVWGGKLMQELKRHLCGALLKT